MTRKYNRNDIMGFTFYGIGMGEKLETISEKAKSLYKNYLPEREIEIGIAEAYTEWWLEKKGKFDLTADGEKLNEQFRNFHIKEVPLHKAVNIQVDIISVVEDDLNEAEVWCRDKVDAEQFLVGGKSVEVGSNIFYRQGFNENLEGRFQQRADRWMESLD